MSKKQTAARNEIWEFGGDISQAFETTDLGQAVSADVDDISTALTEHILEKFLETYELAGELSKKNPKNHFSTFQGLLRDFKDWDPKTRKKFTRKVKRSLSDISQLIRSSIVGVSQIRFIWIAKTKGLGKRECNRVLQAISLSRIIPETEDFLHWCCCRSVKEIYQHPYLFDNRKRLSKRKRQENLKNVKNIINKAISDEIYSRDNASYIIRSALGYVNGGSYSLSDKENVSDGDDSEGVEEVEEIKLVDPVGAKQSENKEETSGVLDVLEPEQEIENEHYANDKEKTVKTSDDKNVKEKVKEDVKVKKVEVEKVKKSSKKKDKPNSKKAERSKRSNRKQPVPVVPVSLYDYDESESDEASKPRKRVIKRRSERKSKNTKKSKHIEQKQSSHHITRKPRTQKPKHETVEEPEYFSEESEYDDIAYYSNEDDVNDTDNVSDVSNDANDVSYDVSDDELEPNGEEEEQYWSTLRNDLNKRSKRYQPQSKKYTKKNSRTSKVKKTKPEVVDDNEESDYYLENGGGISDEDVEFEEYSNVSDYDVSSDEEDSDNSDNSYNDYSDSEGNNINDDNDDNDNDDNDNDDNDSFWKTLQNEAEKQLGFGRIEEDTKARNQKKNHKKTETKKTGKAKKVKDNKDNQSSQEQYEHDDLDMLDSTNVDGGIDLDSEED